MGGSDQTRDSVLGREVADQRACLDVGEAAVEVQTLGQLSGECESGPVVAQRESFPSGE